jgi:MoaA/NifB/PqqE/SkfB family radical SAM enzyme
MKLFSVFSLIEAILKNKMGIPTPLALAHMVTMKCNLRCTFCTYWRERKEREMELEEIKDVIDQARALGVSMYSATGGGTPFEV